MSPAHIAARVIAAIGRPDFPDQLLAAFRELAECDFRSPTTSQIARRIEEAGPALIAALRRHTELIEQTSRAPSHSLLLKRVREWGLSAREAQVAAGLATGQRQADIARNAGLTLNSVITYRRRAYQKLRVSDRLELRAMCERMVAASEP